MEKNYTEVPNILTGKDLDYLSDMFNWNYAALKNANNSITKVQDKEIVTILKKGAKIFDANIEMVLDILVEGGQNE